MVIAKLLFRARVRSDYLHSASLGFVWFCLSLWIRAKTVDQEERANSERRAMFVGFWPVMFWLIGDAVEREERATTRPGRLRRVR